MGNGMMKLVMMLLPWVMAKLDQVIEYMLKRRTQDDRDTGSQVCGRKGVHDKDVDRNV